MGAAKQYKLLVIGGSAGALPIALKVIPLLKKEMDLSVIIVFHRKQSEDQVLLDVLSSRTNYIVKEADDKDSLAPGVIYIAPADYHVLIERDHTLTLDDSEKINYSRPSIDVTYESAAAVYGKSLVCLLLSGANADGVAGLTFARKTGAYIVVQDPSSAEVSYMPRQAMENVMVDLVLSEENLDKLTQLLR